ncbi:ornithine carbamoyltransferase [Halomarina pelagica]|uniref:ornithine carbamoyltransferase n=1 Tax=Halomarina pelagica TaxID=2961599 RepID=UPI0020C37CEC|nr:ornithine carbamoyltransferase [Halomarina sp. BND7]
MVRHFLDVDDLTAEELLAVLDRAATTKAALADGTTERPLADRTLAMVFEKPSTRTRVSFETGMTQLGGHAMFLGPEDIQLGHGEPLRDTARVLSRYVDVVMARLFDHADLEELAAHATVPVVNGLTDDAHPCQTLADLLTIREAFGGFDVDVTWVGDGNNVAQSFVLGCAMAGVDLTVVTPAGYAIDDDVLDRAGELGTAPTLADDPADAASDADVVYTDVWVSMGQEDQRAEKLAAFEGFQVNEELLAGTDARVMHCLPAHRGEEITDGVLESERALVWDQAENRMHAQKALLVTLLE